jgi:hypothetical protein
MRVYLVKKLATIRSSEIKFAESAHVNEPDSVADSMILLEDTLSFFGRR